MDLLDFINGRVAVRVSDNEQANTLYRLFQDEVTEEMLLSDIPWYDDNDYIDFPYVAIKDSDGRYIPDGFSSIERIKRRFDHDVVFVEFEEFINSENCKDVVPDIDVNEVI